MRALLKSNRQIFINSMDSVLSHLYAMLRLSAITFTPIRQVVVRKKSRIVGNWELFKDYMRPRRDDGEILDAYELFKIFVYMSMPITFIVIWRATMKSYPDYVETNMHIFEKPVREEIEKKSTYTTYAEVIDGIENMQTKSILGARRGG